MTFARSLARPLALAALMGLALAPNPAQANPGTVYPTKHTTYTFSTTGGVMDFSIKVVIGSNTHKVKKVTVKETCTAGAVEKSWKGLKLSDSGVFTAPKHQDITTPFIITGFWKTKHKAYLTWHHDDVCGRGDYDGLYAKD